MDTDFFQDQFFLANYILLDKMDLLFATVYCFASSVENSFEYCYSGPK